MRETQSLDAMQRGGDLDQDAAELVDRIKWATLLPYEKLHPEAQEFWRELARAIKSLR